VNGFGVKYIREDHANHLLKVPKEHYVGKKDWTGKKYYG
jgi:hypothetical protein